MPGSSMPRSAQRQARTSTSKAPTAAKSWARWRPSPGDLVFTKKKPSSFHGTPLLPYLIDRAIDTLIVTGGATCNCVRATVFDAFSYNYRTIVPSDAVFDRLPISHAINLFDMNRCSADVTDTEAVLTYFAEQAQRAA